MKYNYLLVLLLILSCSSNKPKDELTSVNSCASGYILMVYLGENDKFISPLLLWTNAKDSSYLQYIGDDKDKLEKNGFIITELESEEYMNKTIIDTKTYRLLKKYILDNNTNRDLDYWNANRNSIKIILKDGCDSLKYSIDHSNIGYFSNLIDSIEKFQNKELEENLLYYKNIQEFNEEDLYKSPTIE